MMTVAHMLRRGLLLVALTATALAPTAASAQSLTIGPANGAAYVADSASATVVFGDGATGRRPSAGSVFAASYQYATGAAGNVPTSPNVFDFESVFCLEFGC